MVALKGLNDRAFLPMLRWRDAQGHDLTLIETMPLGMIDEDRTDRYLPLAEALDQISAEHKVTRSEEHTSELQSLMRISYAVFCLKKKKKRKRMKSNHKIENQLDVTE